MLVNKKSELQRLESERSDLLAKACVKSLVLYAFKACIRLELQIIYFCFLFVIINMGFNLSHICI